MAKNDSIRVLMSRPSAQRPVTKADFTAAREKDQARDAITTHLGTHKVIYNAAHDREERRIGHDLGGRRSTIKSIEPLFHTSTERTQYFQYEEPNIFNTKLSSCRKKLPARTQYFQYEEFSLQELLARTQYFQYEAISGGGRDVKNPRRRIEVFERLQNHTVPRLFMLRCVLTVYPSRKLSGGRRDVKNPQRKFEMYFSRELSGGGDVKNPGLRYLNIFRITLTQGYSRRAVFLTEPSSSADY
ncbi:hypothetical protein BDR04DRAFT_1123331 [Suillus decipiens]|nr:hypothetical protein BDR04DRAFT_1123331 [Suillus decipiens]